MITLSQLCIDMTTKLLQSSDFTTIKIYKLDLVRNVIMHYFVKAFAHEILKCPDLALVLFRNLFKFITHSLLFLSQPTYS